MRKIKLEVTREEGIILSELLRKFYSDRLDTQRKVEKLPKEIKFTENLGKLLDVIDNKLIIV